MSLLGWDSKQFEEIGRHLIECWFAHPSRSRQCCSLTPPWSPWSRPCSSRELKYQPTQLSKTWIQPRIAQIMISTCQKNNCKFVYLKGCKKLGAKVSCEKINFYSADEREEKKDRTLTHWWSRSSEMRSAIACAGCSPLSVRDAQSSSVDENTHYRSSGLSKLKLWRVVINP